MSFLLWLYWQGDVFENALADFAEGEPERAALVRTHLGRFAERGFARVPVGRLSEAP